jgi:NAD(P)-dependent dehydrogenase (short-subunit alcohol dehydrogenase family)
MSIQNSDVAPKFGHDTTALEVIKAYNSNLKGYEVIVTGASSGIGIETARALAQAGARVIIGARDLVKAEEVAKDVRQSTGNDQVEVEKIELDNLASVNDFVKRYLAKDRPLHILVNNAGIMGCPLSYTVDGFESQFGTNHMGHFALTIGLLPALKRGVKESGRNVRVVNVSSLAHRMGDVDFNDINFKNGRVYAPFVSYGQSKTANILFSNALTKHYSNEGIFSNSLMPGAIPTNLQRHMSLEDKQKRGWVDEDGNVKTIEGFKTIEQGASTSVWAAVAPELDGVGGKYFVSFWHLHSTIKFFLIKIRFLIKG